MLQAEVVTMNDMFCCGFCVYVCVVILRYDL